MIGAEGAASHWQKAGFLYKLKAALTDEAGTMMRHDLTGWRFQPRPLEPAHHSRQANVLAFFLLFKLPLHEPAFIECDAEIDAEGILANQTWRRTLYPLG